MRNLHAGRKTSHLLSLVLSGYFEGYDEMIYGNLVDKVQLPTYFLIERP
jgi:hypothetical protein